MAYAVVFGDQGLVNRTQEFEPGAVTVDAELGELLDQGLAVDVVALKEIASLPDDLSRGADQPPA